MSSIPPFNDLHVLPWVTNATKPAERSPYQCTITDLVDRFTTSIERANLLLGLLELRSDIRSSGITMGFQWINGSFSENIEEAACRAPRDIDVLTLTTEVVQPDVEAKLFVGKRTAKHYRCDSHLLWLGYPPSLLVNHLVYWFGLFSHRRDGLAKGMLQLHLGNDQEDQAAYEHITRYIEQLSADAKEQL